MVFNYITIKSVVMENDQSDMRIQDELRSTPERFNDAPSITEPLSAGQLSETPIDGSQPLRKIHAKPHGTGRYKMFSNHSSANDMPRTSTGA